MHVAAELSRVYRCAREGSLAWSDATAASFVLTSLRKALESAAELHDAAARNAKLITVERHQLAFDQLLDRIDVTRLSQAELDALETLSTAPQLPPPNGRQPP